MAEEWMDLARALRVTENLNQFSNFLQQVAEAQMAVPESQAQAQGYVLLQEYHEQARAMAASPANTNMPATVNDNEARRQLQRIMLDSTARRFKAYRLVSDVKAVMRWVDQRAHLLQGQEPGQQHIAALAEIDAALQQELAGNTDQKAYDELRARDEVAGFWMAEMASLQTLLGYIQGELTE